MAYESIDRILNAWADAHGLHIYKEYKDSVVRSVEDRSAKPFRYQIWVDEPDGDGTIGVHVWDFEADGRRSDFSVQADELRNCLENVLEIAKGWD